MGCILSLFKNAKEDGSESLSSTSRPSGKVQPNTPISPAMKPETPFDLPPQEAKKTYSVSRPKAVRAFRHNGNDIVISIMELTM